MSEWILRTEESGHTRHYGLAALPVTIGGDPGSDIVLADVAGAIQIGQLDGVFFVQPAQGAENVRLDGEPLRGSRRLTDGSVIALDSARLTSRLKDDRLYLDIEARVTAGDTAPPDFAAVIEQQRGEVTVSPIAFDPKSRRSQVSGTRVSKASIAVYAAFVVLALLGWFAFTAKSVEFETVPQAASLELPDTWIKFRFDERYLLRPGQHRVVAALDGYYPIDDVVEIDASADQTVALEFVRLPGLITFATEPEAGAEVRLDGELIGTTPLEDVEVRPGTHRVQFTAERYLTELETLEVEGGHSEQTVSVELTPSWAPVAVVSRPAGAEVRVDGRVLGRTPAELELTAGDREIEVALQGYDPWRQQIRVVANEPQTLADIELSLADGRLMVSSVPAGASIFVDGTYRDLTPSTLRLEPNTEHRIAVTMPGFVEERLALALAPGASESIDLELAEELGIVEVTSSPDGAEVVVNGETRGLTPMALELRTVEQNVAVRLEGYAGDAQAITPRAGYPLELAFTLDPLDRATGGGFPRVVTTGFGRNLRLIPAGRLQMGASRSEQGALVRETNRYREVEISQAFYLAETEMTNAEYRRCDPDHDSGTYEGLSLNEDDQPVVNITVREVVDCLNQLSIEDGLQPVYQERDGVLVPFPNRSGYRLPTEAEFALAMRKAGLPDDAEPLRFGWGQSPVAPPRDRIANIADLSADGILPATLFTYTDGFPVSAPVASFEPNAAGIYDMDGNVSEWVQDFYDPIEQFSDELIVDPRGPETGRTNIVRGPSWKSRTERELRLSYLEFEDSAREDIGFRIARNLQ